MTEKQKRELLSKILNLIEGQVDDLTERKDFIENDLTDELDNWTSDIDDQITEAEDEQD